MKTVEIMLIYRIGGVEQSHVAESQQVGSIGNTPRSRVVSWQLHGKK